MSLISVQQTPDYDPKTLARAVGAHLEALDLGRDLRPGIRVLLKPNLLSARRPEQGITTHPAVVQAVVNWLRGRGVTDITLADSPGGLYTPAALRSVYAACGMNTLTGVSLNLDAGFSTVACPDGGECRSFSQIVPVGQADLIINLPKLKTHAMTGLSGGIKNLFGTVPGLQKPQLHCRFPGKEEFAGMLLDLAAAVKPQVTLVDGVVAMEGDGPSGGSLRQLGYTFASRELYTLDWFLCGEVMGMDPGAVPMLAQAMARGLVEQSPRLTGDPLLAPRPFLPPRSHRLDFMDHVPGPLQKPALAVASWALRSRPAILRDRCIGCGRCAESCPVHTITIREGKAVIRLGPCIGCFCCHEMCPVQAVRIRRLL